MIRSAKSGEISLMEHKSPVDKRAYPMAQEKSESVKCSTAFSRIISFRTEVAEGNSVDSAEPSS